MKYVDLLLTFTVVAIENADIREKQEHLKQLAFKAEKFKQESKVETMISTSYFCHGIAGFIV
jgi:hypothetical protein